MGWAQIVSVMSRSTRPRLITDFAFGALFYLGSIFGEGVEFRAMATPGASDGAFTESRSKEKNSRLQATNGRGRAPADSGCDVETNGGQET